MKALASIVLLVAVPAALASHPSRLRSQQANLDRDRALETVVGVEDVSRDHSVWRAHVRIVDRCRGRARQYVVLDGYRQLVAADPVQADGRGANEVLAVLRGASADGEGRLVRLVPRRGRCATTRRLFRYVAAETDRPAPGQELTHFDVEVVELQADYAGRELRVTELFQSPPMLSSIHRERLYRYLRARDAYVLYATNTHRVP